jgi:hypothetical protein
MLHILFLVLKVLAAYFGVGFVLMTIWLILAGRDRGHSGSLGVAFMLLLAWPFTVPYLFYLSVRDARQSARWRRIQKERQAQKANPTQ